MRKKGLHTDIIETRQIGELEIIREDYFAYPKEKSNIYARGKKGEVIWFAELPIAGDSYSGNILWNRRILSFSKQSGEQLLDDNETFCVSSWAGYTVCISYDNGKILDTIFTK